MAITIAEALVRINGDNAGLKKGLGEAENETNSALSRIAANVSRNLGGIVTTGIVTAIGAAVASITGLGLAANKLATEAAPLQGVMDGFAVSAAKAGKSYDEFLGSLTDASGGLVTNLDLMRAANVALTGSTGEFAQQFGEALPTLLRAAQVAAKQTGQDVTFLFNSLVTGVKRSSPLLIDNTGIVLSVGAANEAMAASLGKTVEQLTEQELQLALLNSTLEASERMIAESGDASLTAADKLGQWRVALQNTRDDIGLSLQPALSNLMDGLQRLGDAVLPQVAEAFVQIGGSILSAGGMIAGSFEEIIAPAGDWGKGLGLAFAQGLQSVIPVIVGVIRGIGRIIEYWFAPGSPPRIAREIDKWGAAMVREFFAAFENADLNEVQGFARSVGDLLDDALGFGIIGERDVSPLLSTLREQFSALFEELKTGGAVSEEAFARLRTAAGKLGPQVEKIARRFLGQEETGLTGRVSTPARGAEATRKATDKALKDLLGGGGASGADLEAIEEVASRFTAGLGEKPKFRFDFEFDTEALSAKADSIADQIFESLKPAVDKSGGNLGKFLGEALRTGLTAVLFGAGTDKVWVDELTGTFELKPEVVEAKSWAEIGAEIQRRLEEAVDWAAIGTWIGDKIGTAIADGIEKALGAKKTETQRAVADWSRDVYNEIPLLPDMAEPPEPEALGGGGGSGAKTPSALERLWGGVASWFEGVRADLDESFDSLIGKSDDADTSVADLVTNTDTNLQTMSTGVAQHMQATSDDWAAKWMQIDETHELTWQDILQAASEGGILLGADILSNITNILLLMQGKQPEWKTQGQGMMTAAAAGVDAKNQTLIDSILKPVEDAMDQIEELWENWTPPWENKTPPTTPPPAGGATPGFASGTSYYPGGWGMVGEQGRELVRLPRGSDIFSAGQTTAMMGAAAAPVTVNIGPVTVREDEDIQALAWRVAKEIERRR